MRNNLLLLFVLVANIIYAQATYVSVDDEIYAYLNRMSTMGILEDYDSFELPKSRKKIANYLLEIDANSSKLVYSDAEQLKDFLVEFEFDIYRSMNRSAEFIPNFNFSKLFFDAPKYLYKYSDDHETSLKVNFVGQFDYLHSNNVDDIGISNSTLYKFGGEIEATLFRNFGLRIKATNGSFFGNRNLARSNSTNKFNYKLNNEETSEIGKDFYDETESYLSYQNKFLKLKFGNDRLLLGYGKHKTIFSNNAPRMEYLNLNLIYKSLEFSFIHGKLLGSSVELFDSIQGGINYVSDKYVAYHRLRINTSKYLKIGLGEIIIYANRNIDFSYLNPFNFYKSSEHANQDRDNSMIIFDLESNPINGIKLYSNIIIDDIDFGKIGTGWYGNKTLMNFGVYSSLLYNLLPLDFEVQYLKIDPYVYSHRITDNNFTNQNYSLGSVYQPNSSSIMLNLYCFPTNRLTVDLGFAYSIHGANKISDDGSTIQNFGGDINLGHRDGDATEVYFLAGDKEILRKFDINIEYEPIFNWIFRINSSYYINSLAKSQTKEELFFNFGVSTKL